MSESREQFLTRLSEIGFRPGENWQGDWMRVKEAVYTEALRDVRNAVGHYLTGYGDGTIVADEIHAWAYVDLGIDLDATP